MEIDTEPLTDIEIGATGIREIYQNVKTILSTLRGAVFLDRHFGINGALLDSPTPSTLAQYRNDVISEVEKQEPRVKVVSITFIQTANESGQGGLKPVVKIRIREGVLL